MPTQRRWFSWTRVVDRCLTKVRERREQAARNALLMGALATLPVAVTTYAVLERFAPVCPLFRVVAVLGVALVGLAGGHAWAKYQRRRSGADEDDSALVLRYLEAREPDDLRRVWQTLLSTPSRVPPHVRRGARQVVLAHDARGWPDLPPRAGPDGGLVLLTLALSVAGCLLAITGFYGDPGSVSAELLRVDPSPSLVATVLLLAGVWLGLTALTLAQQAGAARLARPVLGRRRRRGAKRKTQVEIRARSSLNGDGHGRPVSGGGA